VVKYTDLDLSTARGQAQLEKRIDRAARAVCTSHQLMTGTVRSTSLDEACYEQARLKVREQVAAVTGLKLQG
jgi:UrcA family protein